MRRNVIVIMSLIKNKATNCEFRVIIIKTLGKGTTEALKL